MNFEIESKRVGLVPFTEEIVNGLMEQGGMKEVYRDQEMIYWEYPR